MPSPLSNLFKNNNWLTGLSQVEENVENEEWYYNYKEEGDTTSLTCSAIFGDSKQNKVQGHQGD